MRLNIPSRESSYEILIERGILNEIGRHLDLKRKVLVITDRGVPIEYANTVCQFCDSPFRVTVEPGEGSKGFETYEKLCKILLENNFSRTDCIVAVGGGVVGDLAGFVASTYMRGIDFYNIPTTLLSQIDSSIGGKTAINLNGVKNIIGCFYQPKKVIIDPNTLKTLPKRQLSNGLAEIIKMAICFDEQLFEMIESDDIFSDEILDQIIERSLTIKKNVVEADEKEKGLRRVLNFGHTIGHGIEFQQDLSGLYHGECAAIGMLPMCAPEIRGRVRGVLSKASLPIMWRYNTEKIYNAILHDKKVDGGKIALVFCDKIGSYRVDEIPIEDFKKILQSTYGEQR